MRSLTRDKTHLKQEPETAFCRLCNHSLGNTGYCKVTQPTHCMHAAASVLRLGSCTNEAKWSIKTKQHSFWIKMPGRWDTPYHHSRHHSRLNKKRACWQPVDQFASIDWWEGPAAHVLPGLCSAQFIFKHHLFLFLSWIYSKTAILLARLQYMLKRRKIKKRQFPDALVLLLW